MNELLKDKLRALAEDEVLLSALVGVLEEAIETHRPVVEEVDDNSLLGQKFRAYEISKDILNTAFLALQSYKVVKSDKRLLNRAR